MKKNFKRWLALLLAVIMIASTGLSHADGFLKATEGDVTETTEGTEELVVTDDTVEGEQEEPVEKVQTLEVPKDPEEVMEESQEPEASQPTETPETQEEPVETPEEITYQVVFNEPNLAGGTIFAWAEGEKKQEVSYGTARELKEGAVLHFTVAASENFEIEQVMANDAALSTVSGDQKSAEYEVKAAADTQITVVYKDVTPVEKIYPVVFNEPKLAGGTISVWAEGEEKQTVSYHNGKFTKEVKEGDTLYFEITNADNYAVEKVTDQAGEALQPEKTAEETSTYKMAVNAQNEINVVYQEVKPAVFNAEDESDRLLGEEEYPEYLTASELGALDPDGEKYQGGHEIVAGSINDSYLEYNKETNKWVCTLPEEWGFGSRGQHYVAIRGSNNDANNITYVRCDVYGGEQAGKTYYQVTFINESTGQKVNKSVQNGFSLSESDIPDWEPGYWTLSGETAHVEPLGYTITEPTTFVWHKQQGQYQVSYWEKKDKYYFDTEDASVDTYLVAEKYTAKPGGNRTHDQKHVFAGWITKDGVEKYNLKGSLVLSSKEYNTVISDSEVYRAAGSSYKGLEQAGEIKLFALWAEKSVIEGNYQLTVNHVYGDETTTEPIISWKKASDSIEIKAAPKDGYKLDKVTITGGLQDTAEEDKDTVKGTMPASDVTVTFHYVSAGELQPVYIYVQITGKIPEGATLNKDGWYTVGMSQLYIPCKPEDKGHGYDLIAAGNYQLEDAKAALDVPPFVDFNENDGIFANEIKEKGKKFELKAVSSGATDYLGDGYCWHLDIQVKYEDIQDKFVNVIYTDGVENATVFEDKVFAGIEGTNTPGYGADPSRPGYDFAGWNPEVADVLIKPADGHTITYTATWTPNFSNISVTSYEDIYDGKSHGVTVTGTQAGDTIEYSADGENWKKELTYKDVKRDGEGNAAEYPVKVRVTRGTEIYTEDASVTILPKDLKVSKEATKTYTGEAQTMAITAGDIAADTPLVAGDKLTITAGITGTNAGDYTVLDNDSSWSIQNAENEDVTGNYNISVTGKLTITKAGTCQGTVTMEGWTYGDQEQYPTARVIGVGDYATPTFYYKEKNEDDNAYTTVKPKNAGTYIVKAVWAETENCAGISATDEFVISKKAVIVQAENKTAVYGKEIPELTYQVSKMAYDETLEKVVAETDMPTLSTTATKNSIAGNYPITFSKKTLETENYEITFVGGTLTITKREGAVRISAYSAYREYNGQPLTAAGFLVVGDLAEGDQVTDVQMTVDSTITDYKEGGQPNTIASYKIVNQAGEDVTDSYDEIVTIPGKLLITKKRVTVTANDKTKEYGAPVPELDYIVSGIVEGEKLEEVTTVPGLSTKATETSQPGSEHPIEFAEQSSTAQNYTITYVDGTLRVTENTSKIEITAGSDSRAYNGKPLKNSKATVTSGKLAEGDYIASVTMTDDSKIIHVQKIAQPNKIANVVIKNAQGKDVTEYYGNLKYADGTLTITPKKVTLKSQDLSKTYDGEALTNDNTPVVEEGWVGEEGATYVFRGSQRLVGKSFNRFAFSLNEGTLEDDYEITKTEGTLTVTDEGTPEKPIDPKNVITKTHEGEKYGLGEVITFNIEAKNIYAEKKTMQFEEKENVDIIGDSVFTDVEPGNTVKITATYKVGEDDILAGSFTNIVKVKFLETGKEFSAQDIVKLEEPAPAFTATKTLINKGTGTEGKFKVGDIAKFDITVTNTGNVTLNDVTVKEELAGAKFVKGDSYTVDADGTTATITTMAAGATVTLKAEYTVTQEDVDKGGVTNSVVVEGDGAGTTDPEPVDPEAPVDTEDPNPKMSVVKTVTSSPRENGEYHINDTITYKIIVTNTGNVTLNDVIVQDKLNASGQVTWAGGIAVNEKNEAVIGSMKPGETVTLNCSYVVTAADAGKDLVNAAVGDSKETDPTPPSTTDPTEVESYYNLTINYVYADGSEAAPSVYAQYLKGESFGYASPVIDGFTPNFAFVRTGADGMPAQDVTVNVIYTANAVPVVPTPNPGTPEGEDTPAAPAPGTDTPDTPTTGAPGGTGGAGQTGTPTAPTPAAQGTPEEPVGAEVGVNEDGELEIVPVIDEEVPLANRELDEHECCMLHFLLMLAAMIVYAFYTRSMKKRQARIAELADQLETELLKRKQGTAE